MTRTYDIAHITDCHDTNPEGGLLAATKVEFAYSALTEDAGLPTKLIRVLPAEEFNTIDVGAKFSELVTSSLRPERLIVAVNAAPPSIPGGGRTGNDRINFVLGRLKNGVVFGGTWGGHCLSYVKPQIAELYELNDSNSYGTQFRSLVVLPPALVQFANGTIDPARLDPVTDIRSAVPDVPAHSHAWTIDNFGNVKLVVSDADVARLRDTFTRHNGKSRVGFAFGPRSIEFGSGANDLPAPEKFHDAHLAEKMFRAAVGDNILSLTSSAKRFNEAGGLVDVPQVATLRDQPHLPLGYQLPHIGAPLHLRVS